MALMLPMWASPFFILWSIHHFNQMTGEVEVTELVRLATTIILVGAVVPIIHLGFCLYLLRGINFVRLYTEQSFFMKTTCIAFLTIFSPLGFLLAVLYVLTAVFERKRSAGNAMP
jgi:hypothetical protein